MEKQKKELVKDIVYNFADLSKITDTKMCDNLVEKLLNLDTDDSIDTILFSLQSSTKACTNLLISKVKFFLFNLTITNEIINNTENIIKYCHHINSSPILIILKNP